MSCSVESKDRKQQNDGSDAFQANPANTNSTFRCLYSRHYALNSGKIRCIWWSSESSRSSNAYLRPSGTIFGLKDK